MATFAIKEEILDEVTAALNRAIALAMRFEPSLVDGIMKAATSLDDAINSLGDDEDDD